MAKVSLRTRILRRHPARVDLLTRIQRRGDELVITIPDYLHPTHAREGDEVSVALRSSERRNSRRPGRRAE